MNATTVGGRQDEKKAKENESTHKNQKSKIQSVKKIIDQLLARRVAVPFNIVAAAAAAAPDAVAAYIHI